LPPRRSVCRAASAKVGRCLCSAISASTPSWAPDRDVRCRGKSDFRLVCAVLRPGKGAAGSYRRSDRTKNGGRLLQGPRCA
jgi:hypothetical protein